ncbi:transcriptional regulator, AraC family [Denitrovibrio acetiphilus DSM 12809]|uniref:Transcriptional regulator, AraC family n=1 Tax=Denitrovibrio acetiphilus (strain DSM 12809 / NBRC 114555 / N2460) TaxID=522772 RepID=D4H493_DENA2|nr:AraC family transcriptional regulator [Denitrovibrio acetiphilus]ADD69222.1 transcriptional regulator, AraC family [Denitrovibrio acetiphilus DSM 12809]
MSAKNIFWRDKKLPFLEIRQTEASTAEYKRHSHEEYFSVGAVDAGETVMSCGDTERLVSAGTLVFFNPDEIHSCNPADGHMRSYWMMYLEKDWCRNIQKEMFGCDDYMPVNICYALDQELFDDFLFICKSIINNDDLFDAEYELTRFCSYIFEKFCSARREADIHSNVLGEIESYLAENFFINISLDALAERFRQNRFHLLRSFRNAYGLPPHAYQMNLRIQRAKEMLRLGSSISETALAVGFTDQSHFHRMFRKLTAATPGEYLKGQ